MTRTRSRGAENAIEIPVERDPRLAAGTRGQQQRVAKLSPTERAALVLERYPGLRALPNCDWQRLSARSTFSILFGASSRHFACQELAGLAAILASAGVSSAYATDIDASVRRVLDLLQQRFGITTPRAISLDMWEAWARDTDLMRTLTHRLRSYGGAVNHHVGAYRERLSPQDQARVAPLLLPPLPKQFHRQFVPEAEERAIAQGKRKAKTDVVSECAIAILALMLAR